MKKYDYIVYIGRFQPFHDGHLEAIKHGLVLAKNVIVLIGSPNSPRTIKNPLLYSERERLIRSSFIYDNSRIIIAPIRDYPYNDGLWIEEVGKTITEIVGENAIHRKKVAIMGHDKDHTTFYLNYFPQFKYVDLPAYPEVGDTIDATKIRTLLFEEQYGFIKGVVPPSVFAFLMNSKEHSWFKLLKKEYSYIKEYRKSWENTPHPPIFVTADAVVVQSGHILLVRRKTFPGKGLWALPGGFIGEKESIKRAVVRELREETKLKMPEKILSRMVENAPSMVFDDPERSSRGRTVTHAFLFKLNDGEPLPKVKGGDDAEKAKWVPLSELDNLESVFFEDHHAIASKMIQFIN